MPFFSEFEIDEEFKHSDRDNTNNHDYTAYEVNLVPVFLLLGWMRTTLSEQINREENKHRKQKKCKNEMRIMDEEILAGGGTQCYTQRKAQPRLAAMLSIGAYPL